ncbi:hypothetical protein LNP26_28655 [Klebsiella variicola subsp. variicola]|nr:hypothetical protein [Klebsiella variicola subsp. variicola]
MAANADPVCHYLPVHAIQPPLVERLIEIILHTDRQHQLQLLAQEEGD